jgi:hypothetical protein
MGGPCSTNGRYEKTYNILVGKPEGRDDLEDLRINGKGILEWILGKYGGRVWTGLIWLRIGTSDGLL